MMIVITRFVFERSQFPLKGSFPATRPVADDSYCIGGDKVRVEDGQGDDCDAQGVDYDDCEGAYHRDYDGDFDCLNVPLLWLMDVRAMC